MPALFYFEIPMVVGTSVIAEIGRHFAESEILTDGGNLTIAFLEGCGEERLRNAGFLHGQPGPGAAAYLQELSDAILLLRDPMDRMISHYLHMLREPDVPWHRAATELGFRDFIETYPHFLALQTISIATAIGRDVQQDRIYDRLPDVIRYLEHAFLLATIDQVDEFMTRLASMKQWPAPAVMAQPNEMVSGEEQARHALEESYTAVARSAHLGAVMIAAERTLYATAKNIAAAQRARTPRQEPDETGAQV
jgi:hypothetical protein